MRTLLLTHPLAISHQIPGLNVTGPPIRNTCDAQTIRIRREEAERRRLEEEEEQRRAEEERIAAERAEQERVAREAREAAEAAAREEREREEEEKRQKAEIMRQKLIERERENDLRYQEKMRNLQDAAVAQVPFQPRLDGSETIVTIVGRGRCSRVRVHVCPCCPFRPLTFVG